MTAVILTHPAGATRIERFALRTADLVTAWITERANLRTARHQQMLRSIHAAQTTPRDRRALTYDLARLGITER